MDKYQSFNLLRTARRLEADARINLAKPRVWHVDLSPNAATVTWVAGTRWFSGIGGATIVPGNPLYLDTTTNTYKLADADTDTESVVAGVALNSGISGRVVDIAPPGAVINIGATVTLGTIYVLSTTAGAIAPWADIDAGDYPVVMFIGATSNLVELICKKQYAGTHA